MNNKYKYLGKNTIVFAISSFGTKFLSFLLVPLYTSVLSTEEYGVADLITTTATLMIFIFTINISSSVLRFTLDKRDYGSNILSYGFRIICIGTIVSAILLGLTYISGLIGWPLYYFLFILLYFVSMALYELMSNYLRAIDKVKEVAVAGVLSSLIIIVSNIIFLLIVKVGLIGYLVSLVLGPLFAAIYCMIVVKEPLKTYFVVECETTLKRDMLLYCIPLIFNNIALWINAFLDRYFVTFFCGVSENGIYSVASKIPTILSLCYSVFASAWTLSAIKEFDPKDTDGFFSKTYNTYGALMTTACSGIILLNVPLAHFLYSKDFFVAWQYSSVLLLSVMFNTLTVFQGSIFSAAKQTKTIATTTIISAIANTILNALLIPKMGALGAAIATAVAYFSMWMTRYVSSKKFITMQINLIKDCIIYFIIVLQILFEHFEGHFYMGQVICVLLVAFLNRRTLINIIEILLRKFKYDACK